MNTELTALLVAAWATSSKDGAAPSPAGDQGPTYYADVLPVLQENCQVCHTEQGLNLGGMVAPMAFSSYEERPLVPIDIRVQYAAVGAGTVVEERWLVA